MMDVQTSKSGPKSSDTAAGDGGEMPVKSTRAKTGRCRSSQIPPPPANKFKPQAKRSAAKEDEDRKKSMKNEEEEHVFVGEKEVPPIKEEDKAPVEPVSIPIKSRLPPPDEK
jgi:hypothetical protein